MKKLIPDFQGVNRTIETKRNIFVLFIFNGFNFVFNVLLVRFTLQYLGQENYGVWVTLASLLTWFSNLDFGLGNGLRNKLAEAFAKKELHSAKVYVSTTYALFSSIMLFLYVIFGLVYQHINWMALFNTTTMTSDEISQLVFVVFTFFMITFVLKLISFIVLAEQKPAVNGLFSFLTNLLTIIFVFALLKLTSPSLILLGYGSAFIPIIVFIVASIFLFATRYKSIIPSFQHINLRYSKELIGLGFQFFVIQATGLIVFASANVIITQLYGPREVSVYNVAYRYFNYIPILFLIILNPLWSAYTDAYVKEDFDWIRRAMNKIVKIWVLLSVIVIVMIVAANTVYDLWLDAKIKVPFMLTVLMGILTIITNWNNIFAYFINGTGKIRLQLYLSIFIALLNIPLSIYFAEYFHFGIIGVIVGTIFCMFVGSIWSPIQYYKIINRKAKGIWNR